jgi:thiol-disulfide isomerase/thioredoxin
LRATHMNKSILSDSLAPTPLRAPRLALHSQPTQAAGSMLPEIPPLSPREREQTNAFANFNLTSPKIMVIKFRKFLLCLLLCLPLVGQAADFTLQDMQGKVHHLSDYRGKWVLVNFWATWCPPCLKEIPDLISLHNERKDVVVIGIAMEYANGKLVADFVKTHGVNYPIVLGNSKILAQIGEMEALPTSYLYSPTGEQVAAQAGAITRENIESFIKSRR